MSVAVAVAVGGGGDGCRLLRRGLGAGLSEVDPGPGSRAGSLAERLGEGHVILAVSGRVSADGGDQHQLPPTPFFADAGPLFHQLQVENWALPLPLLSLGNADRGHELLPR